MVEPGDTTILEPDPTDVPPQLPEYHSQVAAVPRLPPLTVKVVLPPEHKVLAIALIDVGATEGAFTVIATLLQAVVLQVPSALT